MRPACIGHIALTGLRHHLATAAFLALFAILSVLPAAAQNGRTTPPPEGPVIRAIHFEGLQEVDRRQVTRILPIREGEPMPRLAPGRLIRDIYATGFFQPDIRIEENRLEDGAIELVIQVKENPLVGEITVAGTEQIKREEIQKVVARLYKPGDIFKAGGEEEIRKAVAGEYGRKGYHEVTVRVESVRDVANPNAVSVRVVVIEGRRRILRDVIIEGNESMSSFMLRLTIENRGSFWPLTNYFDEEAFQSDLERIRMRYINRGYLDVHVERGEFQTGGEGRKAWISPVIRIQEGPRFRVRDVTVRGAAIMSELQITHHFEKVIGRHYSGDRIREALEKVNEDYGDAGYVNAEVDVDFETDPEAGLASIILNVRERTQVHIGRVRIKRSEIGEDLEAPWWERMYGMVAPPVKDEAILQEVKLNSGEVYRHFNEVRTRRNLRNLGIFPMVDIHREPTAEDGVEDVIIEVDDTAPTGRLAVGVGYGDVTQGFVYLDYTERNLFGEARDLQIGLMAGFRAQHAVVTYRDRHLGSSDFSLEVEGFYERFLRRRYDEQRAGGAFSIGHPWGERDQVRVRVKAYQVFLDEDKPDNTLEDLNKNYFVASVRPSVTFDRRDDETFPTRGYLANFGVEVGYADGMLSKFDTALEGFLPLPWEFVFASGVDFGFMPVDAKDVGITERYFMGGSDSLRGFRYRGASPKDPLDDDVAIGGSSVFVWSNELRYPITKELSVLTFHDLGLIGREPGDYGSPRTSAGFGVRYNIPQVTIAVDLGFAIAKEKTDEREIFHLRLGSRF